MITTTTDFFLHFEHCCKNKETESNSKQLELQRAEIFVMSKYWSTTSSSQTACYDTNSLTESRAEKTYFTKLQSCDITDVGI